MAATVDHARSQSACRTGVLSCLCVALFCGVFPASAEERFELFGTIGYGSGPRPVLAKPRGFAVQAGAGYALKRSTSLELMTGYHRLGNTSYSYGCCGPNIDAVIGLVPITLNLTRLFKGRGPFPFTTLGAGVYGLHYDRILAEAPNDLSLHPGFNGGLGLKGKPGMLSARLEVRAHLVYLLSESRRYELSHYDRGRRPGALMRLFVLAIGVQLP